MLVNIFELGLKAQRRALLVGVADGGQRRLPAREPIFLTMPTYRRVGYSIPN